MKIHKILQLFHRKIWRISLKNIPMKMYLNSIKTFISVANPSKFHHHYLVLSKLTQNLKISSKIHWNSSEFIEIHWKCAKLGQTQVPWGCKAALSQVKIFLLRRTCLLVPLRVSLHIDTIENKQFETKYNSRKNLNEGVQESQHRSFIE